MSSDVRARSAALRVQANLMDLEAELAERKATIQEERAEFLNERALALIDDGVGPVEAVAQAEAEFAGDADLHDLKERVRDARLAFRVEHRAVAYGMHPPGSAAAEPDVVVIKAKAKGAGE